MLVRIKKIIKKISRLRICDADDDISYAKMHSTLQKHNLREDERKIDDFYLQTIIRINAHVADKGLILTEKYDRPSYRHFAIELDNNLKNYTGQELPTIQWAKTILKEYEEKYGLR